MGDERNPLLREMLAEFLGTFVLIMFGVGVVAQVVLSGETNGSYLSINLCWGLAVVMGVYVAVGVSGGHINPAVTVALAVHRGFPWRKVAPYVAAQVVGAFLASVVVFLTYREAFDAFDGGVRQVAGTHGTAGIFATYPKPYLSTLGGLLDQIVGTALLVGCIFAIGAQRTAPPPAWLSPIVVGLLVVAIGMAFGANAGPVHGPGRLAHAGLSGARPLVVGADRRPARGRRRGRLRLRHACRQKHRSANGTPASIGRTWRIMRSVASGAPLVRRIRRL